MTRVLLIDEGQTSFDLDHFHLSLDELEVISVEPGPKALAMVEDLRPDAILLRGSDPKDQLESCRWLRQVTDRPIIILSAQRQEENVVRALEMGADDYLAESVRGAELLARLKAIARRSVGAEQLEELRQNLGERTRPMAESQAARSLFLTHISDELRAPLDAIVGYTKLLLDVIAQDSPAEVKASLQDSHERSQHLAAVLKEVVDLVWAAEKEELELEEVYLEDLMETAAAILYPEATQKEQRLIINIDEEVTTIRADASKLRLVLTTLLRNAVKFTPARGTVRLAAERKKNDCIISVSGTGVGIEPSQPAPPFASFAEDHAHTQNEPGPALGSMLVKKLVELHGGQMWAESQAGVGITSYFSIPLKPGR